MKRLTRLVSMALLLSARRRLTAEDLAAHFDVSLRTIYRDVASLEEAGFPIVGTAGDGYTLPATAQARPLAFDPDEAEALVLAARVLERGADYDLGGPLRSALAKLEATLSPESPPSNRNAPAPTSNKRSSTAPTISGVRPLLEPAPAPPATGAEVNDCDTAPIARA